MSDGEIEKRVRNVLHEIRPNLQMDGNDAHVSSCEDGVISIRLSGDGIRSPITYQGLQETVCEKIREYLPDIEQIHVYASDEW